MFQNILGSLPDRKGSNLPVHRQLQRRASVYDLMDSCLLHQRTLTFTNTGLVTDVPDSLVCLRIFIGASQTEKVQTSLSTHNSNVVQVSMTSWTHGLSTKCPHLWELFVHIACCHQGGHSHRVPRSRNQKFHHQKATERTTKEIGLGRGCWG